MEHPTKLTHNGERWVWHGGYSTRHLPSAAGFAWDRAAKQWWTTDDRKAAALIGFTDTIHRPRLTPLFNERQEALAASRALTSDAELPCPQGCAYLPFQKAGIVFAARRDGTLIADEMGLGKTVEAIGLINTVPSIERILILCPSSLKLNWKKEADKWLVRKRSIGIVKGDWFPLSTNIVICNYDVLGRHAKKLRSVQWDLAIIDEAHYLKNAKAKRTKQVIGDGKQTEPIRADRRVLMTGTPIANRPAELWPLLHYLDPDRWPNFYRFASRYCGLKKGPFGLEAKSAENLAELQEILRSTVMIRRLKRDVLTELPAKRRQILAVERDELSDLLNQEQRTWDAARAAIAAARGLVQRCNPTINPREYAAAVDALRRAESVAFTEIAKERHRIAVAKLPDLIAHLGEAIEAGPVVCFVHHKDIVDAVRAAFIGRCVTVTGDHAVEDRQRAVERFQRDESIDLFVGTIGAAGVGFTLSRSSHIVFGELDWVPASLTQAEDRCHRIGQTDSVLVQHLVIDGSLDQKMAEILIRKQGIIDSALDDATEFDPINALDDP